MKLHFEAGERNTREETFEYEGGILLGLLEVAVIRDFLEECVVVGFWKEAEFEEFLVGLFGIAEEVRQGKISNSQIMDLYLLFSESLSWRAGAIAGLQFKAGSEVMSMLVNYLHLFDVQFHRVHWFILLFQFSVHLGVCSRSYCQMLTEVNHLGLLSSGCKA